MCSGQLQCVLSHIEDLIEINARVQKAELALVYGEAQASVSSSNDI